MLDTMAQWMRVDNTRRFVGRVVEHLNCQLTVVLDCASGVDQPRCDVRLIEQRQLYRHRWPSLRRCRLVARRRVPPAQSDKIETMHAVEREDTKSEVVGD